MHFSDNAFSNGGQAWPSLSIPRSMLSTQLPSFPHSANQSRELQGDCGMPTATSVDAKVQDPFGRSRLYHVIPVMRTLTLVEGSTSLFPDGPACAVTSPHMHVLFGLCLNEPRLA
jgi:hypothetical protein